MKEIVLNKKKNGTITYKKSNGKTGNYDSVAKTAVENHSSFILLFPSLFLSKKAEHLQFFADNRPN